MHCSVLTWAMLVSTSYALCSTDLGTVLVSRAVPKRALCFMLHVIRLCSTLSGFRTPPRVTLTQHVVCYQCALPPPPRHP
eukprot:1934085-Rhodomonas_salina.3